MRHDYDLAIIGGGSAGYAAARTAAAEKMRVAVIEGGPQLGGLCILRGCMPTKTLLYPAQVRHLAKKADTWGLKIDAPGFDFAKVMARKDKLIREFASYRESQLTDGRFDLIRATASFKDPHTLQLSNDDTLTAEHFLISTGSVVAPPPLPDLNSIGYLTSDTALALTSPPRSLIVLGGGPIALEFAQFFARFETRVSLIQRGRHVLSSFDADAAREVENALQREGIEIFTDTKITGAKQTRNGKQVDFLHAGEPKTVQAGEILFALGRSPNTANLGLDQAGVETEQGRILTDEGMRTSTPHIFAAGDCTGPHEIVHIAIQQGEIAAENMVNPHSTATINHRLLISVVFTDPQAATVGLTEKAAADQGLPVKVATHPFNDHGKSMIMDVQDGFVKLIAHAATGEIVGGGCVGPEGGELIHEVVVAMSQRMTVHDFARVPHYHPTLAEIWTYPAEALADVIPGGG